MPGRPKDIVGLKAMAIAAQRWFDNMRPHGVKVLAGAPVIEQGMVEADFRELAEAGVPASAVLDTKDLFDNPHLQERGFIHSVEHPDHGEIRLLGWPARMSGSTVPIQAAPKLGNHSAEVVAEDLGLPRDEIERLLADGIIAQPAPT